jgi:hypothetical protein
MTCCGMSLHKFAADFSWTRWKRPEMIFDTGKRPFSLIPTAMVKKENT